ncbi:unnamed protein product [Diamesa hyperborea]
MARKGATVQLQAEITTDDEFAKFLQKDELLIIDVYQGWAGPCTGLLNTLRKAKLEIAGDKLQLAVCDANLITKLKRFRNKCEPTMIFFSRGKVFDIVYGCDIPKLMTTILNQLEMEQKFNEGTIQRTFYEIEEPLPFESLVLDRIKAENEEKARIAKDIADKELHGNLKNIFSEMAESVNDMGVTLFMPHIAESAVKKTSETAKWSGMTIRAKKFIKFTTDILEPMKVYVENQMDDDILEYLREKKVFAMLWGTEARTIVETVLGQFITNLTQPMPATDENDNDILLPSVLKPLVVYLDEDSHDQDVFSNKTDISSEKSRKSTTTKEETPRTSQDSKVSAGERMSIVNEEFKVKQMLIPDEERPKLIIPPAWTPANREGTFFCLYTFFREQLHSIFPPDKEEDPPHLCISLPAAKRDEIFEVCDNYKGYLLESGYFKGDNLEDLSLICKSTKKYEQIEQNSNDQLILKVSKKTSHLALALTTMSPTYVSLNTVDGAKECAMLFNNAFDEVHDIIDTKFIKIKPEVKEEQTKDQ